MGRSHFERRGLFGLIFCGLTAAAFAVVWLAVPSPSYAQDDVVPDEEIDIAIEQVAPAPAL